MKHVSKYVILSTLLLFAASSVFAAQSITVENVSNQLNADTLKAGKNQVINLRLTNNVDAACAPGETVGIDVNNGFTVYSPDGAQWGRTFGEQDSVLFLAPHIWFTFGVNHFEDPVNDVATSPEGDGISPDYLVFFAASVSLAGKMQDGYDEVAWTIDLGMVGADQEGKTICLDISELGKLNAWKWAGTPSTCTVAPDWTERCWDIFFVPNDPPVITNCPMKIEDSHCNTFTFDFDATDPTPPPDGPDPFTFELVSGPGTIDPNSGVWAWNAATLAMVGTSITLEVAANDGQRGDVCSVNIVVTNTGPVLTCPGASVTIQTGDTKSQTVGATDDCDPLTFTISDLGGATGSASIDGNGVLTYSPAATDGDLSQPVVMTVDVTDGDLTAQCAVSWNVITGAPFVVGMSTGNGQGDSGPAVAGRFNTMNIGLADIDVNAGLGGFDFRVVFDASVLNFQSADGGDIYDECGWEYFTYRLDNAGELHLIGIADQNDGPNHPGCSSPTPYVGTLPTTLASMTFLAADGGILGGACVPVRFFWVDCGDNILSDAAGNALLGAKVFDADNATPISDPSAILPTLLGLPQSCVDMSSAERQVDYTNGAFCFITIGTGLRGDINVNGLPHEIADGVMFTNFFIGGLAAFGSHVNESIEASDVNADGISLSVSDLVFMIRVIVGDVPAIPKVDPVVASYTFDGDVLSVSGGSMGAAHIVIRGDVEPKLLADGMDMIFAYDGENTNVLVYSGLTGSVRNGFEGDFLQTTGEIINVDLSTFEGSPVAAKELPANYALNQNYPNPFNPSTVISMALPLAGEYSLTVFNITGQVVAEFGGVAEAGTLEIVWDASELASGVYFYKMRAGDFTATKKAVLLK